MFISEAVAVGGIVAAIAWNNRLERADHPAAQSYSSLLTACRAVADTVARFRQDPIVRGEAKAPFHVSRPPLLCKNKPDVSSDLGSGR